MSANNNQTAETIFEVLVTLYATPTESEKSTIRPFTRSTDTKAKNQLEKFKNQSN